MTDIFFSYSSRDRDRVQRLRDGLVERGFSVFWDQEVPAGTDWDTWIRRHLNDAKCAIVAWSMHSIASDNVRHEATIAKQRNKLVPVMLDAIAADQFPMGLYAVQAANLASWRGDPDDAEWLKLVNQVETKLTPAWVRQTLDSLEAELIAERARRESSERRDRTLREQIVKEAQARQDLQAELDSARDRAAELQARVGTLQARVIETSKMEEIAERLRDSEGARGVLAEQQAAAASRIATLEHTAAELERTKADLAAQASEIVKDAQARQRLQADLDSAHEREAGLRSQLAALGAQLSQGPDVGELSARLRDAEALRQALSDQQATAAARIVTLERTVADLERARAAAESQISATEARVLAAEGQASDAAYKLKLAEWALASLQSGTSSQARVSDPERDAEVKVEPTQAAADWGPAPPTPDPAAPPTIVARPPIARRQIVWAMAPALLGPLFFIAVLLMAVNWQWTWPFPNPPYLGEFNYHAANGATIAAAVWLALIAWQVVRKGSTLSGLEIALYWVAAWLVAAPAIVYVGLYGEWDWLGPYSRGVTAVFVASICALVSGGAIAQRRRPRIEAGEGALYFAGCSVALAVALPIWFEQQRWNWFGAQVAASPGIVLASLAILATAIAIVRRRPSLTRAEVVIYWLVCSIAAAAILLLLGARLFGPVGVLPGLAFVPISGIGTYVVRRQRRAKAASSAATPA